MLEVEAGGKKIKEVSAPTSPAKEGLVFAASRKNGGGRILGTKVTMAGLAWGLTLPLGQPIVDQTGLKGYYDPDLTWPGDSQDEAAGFGSPDFVAGALRTLRDAIGLRGTKTTVPVASWKVTHVEPPTEN